MKTEFVVVLRSERPADEAQTYRRLRAALKVLLRSFGLRCLSIQPAKEHEADRVAGPQTSAEGILDQSDGQEFEKQRQRNKAIGG